MEYYLTEHGKISLNKLRNNLADKFSVKFPFKIYILGFGNLEFNSRDELYGFIFAVDRIIYSDMYAEVKKKNGSSK